MGLLIRPIRAELGQGKGTAQPYGLAANLLFRCGLLSS